MREIFVAKISASPRSADFIPLQRKNFCLLRALKWLLSSYFHEDLSPLESLGTSPIVCQFRDLPLASKTERTLVARFSSVGLRSALHNRRRKWTLNSLQPSLFPVIRRVWLMCMQVDPSTFTSDPHFIYHWTRHARDGLPSLEFIEFFVLLMSFYLMSSLLVLAIFERERVHYMSLSALRSISWSVENWAFAFIRYEKISEWSACSVFRILYFEKNVKQLFSHFNARG